MFKLKNKKLVIVSSLVVLCIAALLSMQFGGNPVGIDGIQHQFNEQRVYEHIAELSGADYDGRRPGTRGNAKAAEYIAQHFREYGLAPGGEGSTYYQHFDMKTIKYHGPVSLEVVDENYKVVEEFKYRYDFVDLNSTRDININGNFEFYLSDKNNDLSSVDVNNGIVVSDGQTQINLEQVKNSPWILIARPKGNNNQSKVYVKSGVVPNEGHPLNVMFITPEVYSKLQIYKKDNYRIKIRADISYPVVSVPNVIGTLKADIETDERLIICGHFDHIGQDPTGEINYGAVDNASGVAVMMEVAKALSSSDIKLPFNIDFIAFNGEEAGLLGAYHYVENMNYPKEKLKVINLDMIGFHDAKYLDILGSDAENNDFVKDLQQIAEGINIETNIKQDGGGSDHLPFIEAGVNAVMMIHHSNNCFENYYHNPFDVIKNVSKSKLREAGNLILKYILNYAENSNQQGSIQRDAAFFNIQY